MGNIRSFKELKAWQMAMDLAMEVFASSKRFPAEERYSLEEVLSMLVAMATHPEKWTIRQERRGDER